MELREMEYVRQAAREGNYAGAAKGLYITPQALGKAVRELERELGASIFYRQNGKLCLTSYGRTFVEETSRLLEQYTMVCAKLENAARQQRGQVSVALGHGILNAIGQERFTAFREAHPEAELEILELPDLLCDQFVREERCDLGISVMGAEGLDGLLCIPLVRYQICAVMAADYPLETGAEVTIGEVAGENILTKNQNYRIYHVLEECARRQGVHLKYGLRSPDEVLWRRMVESRQGIGIGVSFLSESSRRHGLRCIPFAEEDMVWTVCVICREGHYRGKRAGEFVEYLLSEFPQRPKESVPVRCSLERLKGSY